MSDKRGKTVLKSVGPRFRVLRGADIALGPGKVALLEEVHGTGSIREAAQRLNMSYMRAWTLIRTMNRTFKEPLLTASRGGSQRGGARLTAFGSKVLALYRRIERQSLAATQSSRQSLLRLLKD